MVHRAYYRKSDYENYLSTLLLPTLSSRTAAFVLRAFYIELAQVDENLFQMNEIVKCNNSVVL